MDVFVEDRDPDPTLHLEHTREKEGTKPGSESSSEGESGLELDSASGGVEQGPGEACSSDDSEPEMAAAGKETDKMWQGRKGKRSRGDQAVRGEEEEMEGMSRCRISCRKRLLAWKRRVALQQRLKSSGSRHQRTLAFK